MFNSLSTSFQILAKAACSALCVLFILSGAIPAPAQSPNTSSMVVTVVDQNDAVVPGARVTVTNNANGSVRDVIAGADGTATIAGLQLTGDYKVSVTKEGFAVDEVTGLVLRAGETAKVRVRLEVSGAKNEVTVFGTAEGVRADPIIGTRLDGRQIDETPVLGRKVTTLPLLNSAFRQGKGTGDLFARRYPSARPSRCPNSWASVRAPRSRGPRTIALAAIT
jgi:hypothetical protein